MVITEYRDLIYHVEFRNFHSTAKNKTQELKGLQGVLSIHFPSLKRHSYSLTNCLFYLNKDQTYPGKLFVILE